MGGSLFEIWYQNICFVKFERLGNLVESLIYHFPCKLSQIGQCKSYHQDPEYCTFSTVLLCNKKSRGNPCFEKCTFITSKGWKIKFSYWCYSVFNFRGIGFKEVISLRGLVHNVIKRISKCSLRRFSNFPRCMLD